MGAADSIEQGPGMDRPFLFVAGGHPPARRGFVGTVLTVLMAAVGIVIFLGVLLVVAALFVVAIAASLCVVAVRGLVHALSPHSGGRSVEPGGFRPASVIESTATVIRRATPKPRP